jgi:putative oxidoreductase
MRTLLQHVSVLLARVLLSLFFLWNGMHTILAWQAHREAMSMLGVRFVVPLLIFEVFCLVVGGLLLIVGLKGRLGAFLLILFLVPDTCIYSDWSWVSLMPAAEYVARAEEITHCLQNLGLLGGLLLVLGFGSGGFSLDLLMSRRKKKEKKA